MRSSRIHRALCLAAVLPCLALAAGPAQAGDTVHVLVIKEQGVGSAAQAQPFVDKLVAAAGKANGWAGAVGKYATTREAAEVVIHGDDPHYGIMSLGAFLGLRGKHRLEVVGKAEVSQAGGREYHIVSKTATDLAGCKGKTLASNHAGDLRFVEKVVAGGKFALADFTMVVTTRPVQTIKKVIAGEAECALIDDAQYAELSKIEGGAALKSVWKSDKLPPMVVVAFPSAPAAERATFKGALAKVCSGEGKAACGEVGIKDLSAAGSGDYQSVIDAYGK
ncbi:PhnD/SsuA/transferrin family substrate-binding protein [Nannocystis sp.]|uniref:PhnD/SsuA/transferrin family substrate-binding protein n=1 Tax=Nannocystis sp. TaxID=1962667 RepID=UPI0024241691|nr:PhnD/SsuA/transferrin family substrate-binding protein [Nannocystis sp.]MBK7826076.1 hypothetical protein [Nannocystis sp.]MBK9755386.1 hypothetical protein [Nannocystis sp.]